MNWSRREEAAYQEADSAATELRKKRDKAMSNVRESIKDLFDRDGYFDEAVFLKNVDAIRDAMEPFDSGVRVAERSE